MSSLGSNKLRHNKLSVKSRSPRPGQDDEQDEGDGDSAVIRSSANVKWEVSWKNMLGLLGKGKEATFAPIKWLTSTGPAGKDDGKSRKSDQTHAAASVKDQKFLQCFDVMKSEASFLSNIKFTGTPNSAIAPASTKDVTKKVSSVVSASAIQSPAEVKTSVAKTEAPPSAGKSGATRFSNNFVEQALQQVDANMGVEIDNSLSKSTLVKRKADVDVIDLVDSDEKPPRKDTSKLPENGKPTAKVGQGSLKPKLKAAKTSSGSGPNGQSKAKGAKSKTSAEDSREDFAFTMTQAFPKVAKVTAPTRDKPEPSSMQVDDRPPQQHKKRPREEKPVDKTNSVEVDSIAPVAAPGRDMSEESNRTVPDMNPMQVDDRSPQQHKKRLREEKVVDRNISDEAESIVPVAAPARDMSEQSSVVPVENTMQVDDRSPQQHKKRPREDEHVDRDTAVVRDYSELPAQPSTKVTLEPVALAHQRPAQAQQNQHKNISQATALNTNVDAFFESKGLPDASTVKSLDSNIVYGSSTQPAQRIQSALRAQIKPPSESANPRPREPAKEEGSASTRGPDASMNVDTHQGGSIDQKKNVMASPPPTSAGAQLQTAKGKLKRRTSVTPQSAGSASSAVQGPTPPSLVPSSDKKATGNVRLDGGASQHRDKQPLIVDLTDSHGSTRISNALAVAEIDSTRAPSPYKSITSAHTHALPARATLSHGVPYHASVTLKQQAPDTEQHLNASVLSGSLLPRPWTTGQPSSETRGQTPTYIQAQGGSGSGSTVSSTDMLRPSSSGGSRGITQNVPSSDSGVGSMHVPGPYDRGQGHTAPPREHMLSQPYSAKDSGNMNYSTSNSSMHAANPTAAVHTTASQVPERVSPVQSSMALNTSPSTPVLPPGMMLSTDVPQRGMATIVTDKGAGVRDNWLISGASGGNTNKIGQLNIFDEVEYDAAWILPKDTPTSIPVTRLHLAPSAAYPNGGWISTTGRKAKDPYAIATTRPLSANTSNVASQRTSEERVPAYNQYSQGGSGGSQNGIQSSQPSIRPTVNPYMRSSQPESITITKTSASINIDRKYESIDDVSRKQSQLSQRESSPHQQQQVEYSQRIQPVNPYAKTTNNTAQTQGSAIVSTDKQVVHSVGSGSSNPYAGRMQANLLSQLEARRDSQANQSTKPQPKVQHNPYQSSGQIISASTLVNLTSTSGGSGDRNTHGGVQSSAQNSTVQQKSNPSPYARQTNTEQPASQSVGGSNISTQNGSVGNTWRRPNLATSSVTRTSLPPKFGTCPMCNEPFPDHMSNEEREAHRLECTAIFYC